MTQSSASLSWADNSSNEDTFLVERSADGVSGWAQVASTGANIRSYTDSGLAGSTTYYYRVRASNAGGFSGYTNTAAATTAAPQPPAMPSSPTPATGATNLSTKVTVSWVCSNATGYDVLYGPNGNLASRATVTSASATLSGLTAGTSYSWQVVAKNTTGTIAGPVWTFKTKAAVSKGKK